MLLAFSYRFGQIDAIGSRQRRSVYSDDLKGGTYLKLPLTWWVSFVSLSALRS